MEGHGGLIREGDDKKKFALPSVEEDVREIRQAVQRLESRLAEMDTVSRQVDGIRSTQKDHGLYMMNTLGQIQRTLRKHLGEG